MTENFENDQSKRRRGANVCIGAGVGVGLLGVGGAVIGAFCPLCYIVPPLLIGTGLIERIKANKAEVPEPKKKSEP